MKIVNRKKDNKVNTWNLLASGECCLIRKELMMKLDTGEGVYLKTGEIIEDLDGAEEVIFVKTELHIIE